MTTEDERGRPAGNRPAKPLDNDSLSMRAAPVVTQPPGRRRRHLHLLRFERPANGWGCQPQRYGLTDAELLAERDRLRACGVPEDEIAAMIVVPSAVTA